MNARINLNLVVPHEDDGTYERPLKGTAVDKIEVIFDGIKERLIQEIGKWPAVVGCVAWLTDFQILSALGSKDVAQIVVSKEDFLRPDVGGLSKERLRTFYRAIRCPITRYDPIPHAYGLSTCGDPEIEAIRCCGVFDSNRSRPRQHNKFAVFCDIEVREGEYGFETFTLIPRAAWTGSFNWTVSATASFENAVLIRDEVIATAFYRQWGHILAVSEPLDWRSNYAEPEWRVGT